MADERNLILDANQDLGEVMIAPKAIEVIVGIATPKIEDMYEMCRAFASNITELLGQAAHGKGVYLANEEDGLKVDLYYYLEYGVSVPKIAMEMQEWASQQVLFMTDTDLVEINIRVVAVVPEELEQPTIEKFSEDEEEENE